MGAYIFLICLWIVSFLAARFFGGDAWPAWFIAVMFALAFIATLFTAANDRDGTGARFWGIVNAMMITSLQLYALYVAGFWAPLFQ